MQKGDKSDNFAITRLVKDRVPSLPFLLFKNAVLGEKYELSIVIVGDKLSTELNTKYRSKTYIPNVLSFPIDKLHGEIFLNIAQARREYKNHHMKLSDFTALLVVHSMFHLKGMQHGSNMERREKRVLKMFGFDSSY
jgi:rRNA maturation RNase YbeY